MFSLCEVHPVTNHANILMLIPTQMSPPSSHTRRALFCRPQ